ncbi:MAG: class I SAM-dependent methyltransferase [Candidatus Altiarchaeota archaeon]|nr:class I SAM-dependent methyltransferase [Candidatus Altiarchaeota archaeon]
MARIKHGKEETYVQCNLCGGNDYVVVHEKLTPREAVEITEKYSAAKGVLCTDQVVRCRDCGLVYINPRLEGSAIVEACSLGDDKVYVSQEEGRLNTFRKGLKFVEGYAKKGKLLDVGCAAGFFLKVAKDAGWDVKGVEPNKWLGDYGRGKFGVDVFTGTLHEASFDAGSFDLVTMWDVLEHMPDPKAGLREANRVLKNGGILVVSYPDYGSIFSKVLGRRWWFFLSHHLYYFTPKTLERMLEDSGFEMVKKKRHTQSLKIGYMINMAKNLGGSKSAILLFGSIHGALRLTGLDRLQVVYYASQKDVVARKVKDLV